MPVYIIYLYNDDHIARFTKNRLIHQKDQIHQNHQNHQMHLLCIH